jgi:hypothetical protein
MPWCPVHGYDFDCTSEEVQAHADWQNRKNYEWAESERKKIWETTHEDVSILSFLHSDQVPVRKRNLERDRNERDIRLWAEESLRTAQTGRDIAEILSEQRRRAGRQATISSA